MGNIMMDIRKMAVPAAMLALLAACSQAPEADGPAAPDAARTTAGGGDATSAGADASDAGEHASHAADAAGMLPRTRAPAGARVFIVSPKDGETVTTPVRVVFGVEGIGVVPAGEKNDNAGHHHLLINTDLADPGMPIPTDDKHVHYGQAQTEAMVQLPPGKHTLQLVMGDYLHIPFDPVIASPKITLTVN
jgi:hypothetical protein